MLIVVEAIWFNGLIQGGRVHMGPIRRLDVFVHATIVADQNEFGLGHLFLVEEYR